MFENVCAMYNNIYFDIYLSYINIKYSQSTLDLHLYINGNL